MTFQTLEWRQQPEWVEGEPSPLSGPQCFLRLFRALRRVLAAGSQEGNVEPKLLELFLKFSFDGGGSCRVRASPSDRLGP